MRIDAHQHFWNYNDSMNWITPDMHVIRKDFAAPELGELLKKNQLDGCVTVQVDQTEEETQSLIETASRYAFIRGVVGWTDLKARDIRSKLEWYGSFPLLKGFRHILQSEEPEYMLQPDFIHGIQELGRAGFTYDILVFPRHLKAVQELLGQCPDQPFVIDHLAKPDIKNHNREGWAADIKTIAAFPNVYCKVSGMVTEADWKTWTPGDMRPYLDTVAEAFGVQRLIFGSDWPVCLVAASYEQTMSVITDYFSGQEQEAVMGENAKRFYTL